MNAFNQYQFTVSRRCVSRGFYERRTERSDIRYQHNAGPRPRHVGDIHRRIRSTKNMRWPHPSGAPWELAFDRWSVAKRARRTIHLNHNHRYQPGKRSRPSPSSAQTRVDIAIVLDALHSDWSARKERHREFFTVQELI